MIAKANARPLSFTKAIILVNVYLLKVYRGIFPHKFYLPFFI